MKDGFGREIDYLRISVTDLCNLRCVYCMPETGVEKLSHSDILSVEEIIEIARAAAALGVRKIRITGGEPLVRKGILDIVRGIAEIPEIREVCMTTNGTLLSEFAEPLKKAGLARVNISIDSLDEGRYAALTRGGKLADALAGIEAAKKTGLLPLKLNMTLIGGLNEEDVVPLAELTRDEDISVRFIELMPIGESRDWDESKFISSAKVRELLSGLKPLGREGVAEYERLPGAKGTIGLISPVSRSFCPRCNKVRVTAKGTFKPCLHSREEISLKGLKGEELVETMRNGILAKPKEYLFSGGHKSSAARNMNEIGG